MSAEAKSNRFIDKYSSLQKPASRDNASNRFINKYEQLAQQYPQSESEGAGKSTLRTFLQAPLGAVKRWTWPADVANFLIEPGAHNVLNEMAQDDPILQQDKSIAEARIAELASLFPTQGNLERIIEEKTGAPLTPKNKLQKSIRLGSE